MTDSLLDYQEDNTGSCIAVKGAVANGAAVNVQPCSVNITQKAWVVVNGGGKSSPIKIGAESCLDVTDGKDAGKLLHYLPISKVK